MKTAQATTQTRSASKYLRQLCKHFAHKVPADWTETTGNVTFPWGACEMSANETSLTITCQAKNESDMARMKAVIDDHLERFAWREELRLQWSQDG